MCRTLNEKQWKGIRSSVFDLHLLYPLPLPLQFRDSFCVFSVNGAGVKRYFKSQESLKLKKKKNRNIWSVIRFMRSDAKPLHNSERPRMPYQVNNSRSEPLRSVSNGSPHPSPSTHSRARSLSPRPAADPTWPSPRRAAPAGPRFGPAFRRIPSSSEGMR